MAVNAKTQRSPNDSLWHPVTAKWFAVVFGLALCYGVVQYRVGNDSNLGHTLLFVLNKVTSLAGVGFIAASYLVGEVIRWHNHAPASGWQS